MHLVFSAGANPFGDLGVEDDQRLLLRAVAAARQALGAGVTTVRDLGGRGGVTFRVRDAINDGLIPGPRILAAGSPITITGGHCHFLGLEADDEPGVRAAARSQLKMGANGLKIMATGGRMTPGTNVGRAQFSVAEIYAAVDEARRANVPIAAHAIGIDGIRNAAQAGVNTIEHCSWLAATPGVEFDEATAALMAQQGTAAEPTLDTIVGAMKRWPPREISPGLREHITLRPADHQMRAADGRARSTHRDGYGCGCAHGRRSTACRSRSSCWSPRSACLRCRRFSRQLGPSRARSGSRTVLAAWPSAVWPT